MIATLSFRIHTSSIQKATALRDKCGDLLAEEATVIHAGLARDDQTYLVVGVDVKQGERFEEQVDAESEEQAELQVATKQKVVTHVEGVQPTGVS